MSRRYSETQLRDLTGAMYVDYYDPKNSLLSFTKDFTWSRSFDFKYDLSKTLKFSLKTATNSRFDETLYSPVNKKFFPDEYENWRDTVAQSLAHGGRPLDYQQVFTASWDVPINKFPGLDFITAKGQYSATYNWDTGVEYADGMTLGNTISNLAMWQADGQMNFETLYNKSKYLKKINQKFTSRKSTRRLSKFTPKKFSQIVNLTDSVALKVAHRLNSENFNIIFTDASGRLVKVKYKILDKNNIELSSKVNITKLMAYI
jgi:cell surface protein SprA